MTLVLTGLGRGALPLRQVVGDHARRLHCGLAELCVAGEFALNALTFVMHQRAQAFEFSDQIFDFSERRAGDAMDQRVDAADRGFCGRVCRCIPCGVAGPRRR